MDEFNCVIAIIFGLIGLLASFAAGNSELLLYSLFPLVLGSLVLFWEKREKQKYKKNIRSRNTSDFRGTNTVNNSQNNESIEKRPEISNNNDNKSIISSSVQSVLSAIPEQKKDDKSPVQNQSFEKNGYQYTIYLSPDGRKRACIENYCGDNEEVTIPSALGGFTVDQIGEYAFSENNRIRSVYIPDTVSGICSYAFQNCKALEKVSLPERLDSLGTFVFGGCFKLRFVSIPQGINHVDYGIFNGTNVPYRISGNKIFLPLELVGHKFSESIADKGYFIALARKLVENPESIEDVLKHLYESKEKKSISYRSISGEITTYVDFDIIDFRESNISTEMKNALCQCGIMSDQTESEQNDNQCSDASFQKLDDGLRVTSLELIAEGDFYNELCKDVFLHEELLITESQQEELRMELSSFKSAMGFKIDFGEYVLSRTILMGIQANKFVFKEIVSSD